MTDIEALKKKFPTKEKDAAARAKKAKALKAIAREYELKKAELERRGPPMLKKGFLFYGIVLLGMIMVGGLVIQQLLNPPPPPKDKAVLRAQHSVNVLAEALGRYRYDVGRFPTTAEGLVALIGETVRKPGWNGPYIVEDNSNPYAHEEGPHAVKPDPWGHPFVYVYNGETADPTLFSSGPDGLKGTSDDILPDPALFEHAFKDEYWQKHALPADLRGKVVVRSEAERKETQQRIDRILHPERFADEDRENRPLDDSVEFSVEDLTAEEAKMRVTYETLKGGVTNDFSVALPHVWRPSVPILYDRTLFGKTYKYAIRVIETDGQGNCFLNGEKLAVKGVVLPPGFGTAGAAFDADIARHGLARLKDMGANAVTTSPEAPDARLAEICDEMGFLLLDRADFPKDFTLAAFDCGTDTNGLCDALGFPKEGFYLQRARWNEADVTARLFPHWTREGHDGEKIAVTCVTSGDAAELFLNGESQGKRTKKAGEETLTWNVPYESGELKAIVYRNGSVIGETVERTAYRPVAIRLVPEAKALDDGHAAFVAIEIVDDYGTVVPPAGNEVKLTLEGVGEILGGAASCRVREGRTGIYLRRDHGSGRPLRLTATADGLRPATLLLPRRWP